MSYAISRDYRHFKGGGQSYSLTRHIFRTLGLVAFYVLGWDEMLSGPHYITEANKGLLDQSETRVPSHFYYVHGLSKSRYLHLFEKKSKLGVRCAVGTFQNPHGSRVERQSFLSHFLSA